ncbi:MAG TPA: cellulose biosynthesis protein BcsS [Rhizobiales bacterium]|nr:cellulose biosynthesis protein BcsS [Hyphomicrobiales bacterium]
MKRQGRAQFNARLLLCVIITAAVHCAAPPAALAGQGYVIAGFGGGPKALNSYQGVIYAPFGSLSETGLILRGWNKAFRFSYKTDLGPTARNVPILALGLSVEGEIGWQQKFDHGRIAGYGGIVWRDHYLAPADPGSDLTKARIGFSATLDGEYTFSPDYGVLANASFLVGFNQYWVQAKPYMKVGDGWKIGLDAASAGGKTYNNTRFGLFVSDFEFSLWSKKRMFLGAEAGGQFSVKDNLFSPYVGVNVGYLF